MAPASVNVSAYSSDSGPPLSGSLPLRLVESRSVWYRAWRHFLALTRLSLGAVCEVSASLGPHDYHTFADDADAVTWDTRGCGHCRRCGKSFRI